MDQSNPTKPVPVGVDFQPAPSLKSLYFSYLAIVVLLTWGFFVLIPLGFQEILFAGISFFGTVPFFLFTAWWIPLYYRTMIYQAGESEISWRRGVWFRQTGIVPYNRITNIDIIQGPLMRVFGISSLRIQTAGYSAQARAEILLHGIEQPEPLRDRILQFVRGVPPTATETYTAPEREGDIPAQILAEVREIRKVLEKRG
jgi:membrane protein YdbS with pleckstrin-like domain